MKEKEKYRKIICVNNFSVPCDTVKFFISIILSLFPNMTGNWFPDPGIPNQLSAWVQITS